MTSVDHAKTRSSSKFGPICCSSQPIQVVSQEGVDGRATVHDGVRKHDGTMTHTVPGLYPRFDFRQNLQHSFCDSQRLNYDVQLLRTALHP